MKLNGILHPALFQIKLFGPDHGKMLKKHADMSDEVETAGAGLLELQTVLLPKPIWD